MDKDGKCVVFPLAQMGLDPAQINIANHLKSAGYKTACIGKWHLGDRPQFLPTRQGFDYFYGLPYSNDTDSLFSQKYNFDRIFPEIPLMRGEEKIEVPVNQNTLTQRYTAEAVRFIRKNRNKPFFLYLPHTMPHKPPHASEQFRGVSANGLYGDAVEEIDWSAGEIIKTVTDLGLEKNTLLLFTSDNGASQWVQANRGSNLPLRGWKGSTLEGGMRVPFIARWPGTIPEGCVNRELATTMDFLPTIASLAAAPLPAGHVIDGKDIWPLLKNQLHAKSEYEAFYYYLRDQLQAVRHGQWKLHLPLQRMNSGCWNFDENPRKAELYDLSKDLGETKNIAGNHPEIVEKLLILADVARRDLGDRNREGKN